MIVSYLNKVLGVVVDTRQLDIGPPPAFITDTLRLLKPYHTQRKSFQVKDMEAIAGKLIFIAGTALWLQFLMPSMFTSISAAIGKNTSQLARTSKQFRHLLRQSRDTLLDTDVRTFAQGETARKVHSSRTSHFINTTLREELHLIIRVLEAKRMKRNLRSPIAHLVRRDPSAKAWSDSCLYTAGKYLT